MASISRLALIPLTGLVLAWSGLALSQPYPQPVVTLRVTGIYDNAGIAYKTLAVVNIRTPGGQQYPGQARTANPRRQIQQILALPSCGQTDTPMFHFPRSRSFEGGSR